MGVRMKAYVLQVSKVEGLSKSSFSKKIWLKVLGFNGWGG
jgi:hypothetical protein